MFRALLLPFILLASLFHSHATIQSQLVGHAASSIVRITGEATIVNPFEGFQKAQYVCTGEVIAPEKVLTAAHCLGDQMRADGVLVKVIDKDKYYDLALVSVPTAKPAMHFRDRETFPYEALTAIGYAWGYDRLTAMDVHPVLVNIIPYPGEAVGILVQGGYVGGMSGGPVIDSNGDIVSIVQQRTEDGAGFGVGVTVIRAFLLGLL